MPCVRAGRSAPTALPCLEVHEVVAAPCRGAVRQRRLRAHPRSNASDDAEARRSRPRVPAIGLEHQVHRRAARRRSALRGASRDVNTQLCDGHRLPALAIRSSSSCSRRSDRRPDCLLAGLMPITASPQPYSRPSTIEAAMPRMSSVGWLGCSRTARWPGRPIVLRNAVTTRHLRATSIKSWWRISLLTAAAISGVTPGASAASAAVLAASDSSQSRNAPTVRCDTGANAAASWPSTISRVTSSSSYGTSASFRKCASGRSASASRAAIRSSALRAATPASTSPDRSAVARASSVFRSSKRWTRPASVWVQLIGDGSCRVVRPCRTLRRPQPARQAKREPDARTGPAPGSRCGLILGSLSIACEPTWPPRSEPKPTPVPRPAPPAPNGVTVTVRLGQKRSLERGSHTRSKKNPGKRPKKGG